MGLYDFFCMEKKSEFLKKTEIKLNLNESFAWLEVTEPLFYNAEKENNTENKLECSEWTGNVNTDAVEVIADGWAQCKREGSMEATEKKKLWSHLY